MSPRFEGWAGVADRLRQRASEAPAARLNDGQRASLRGIAECLPANGVLIADEVGMGKTRIAVEVARATAESNGRVAILVPPGLGFQWQAELREGEIPVPRGLLRSLWGFLEAWHLDDPRLQKPWFNDSIVMVSHAFTNWRLKARAGPWRFALLPELYACGRKALEGRWPRDYNDNATLDDSWVRNAARSICHNIMKSGQGLPLLKKLVEETPWPGALDVAEYRSNAALRPRLEQAVGLGLGVFDLVIVDEAHKSRGHESGLSRLIGQVVHLSGEARRVAMTATPVELNVEQWQQTLGRVGLSGQQLSSIAPAITKYAAAVKNLRTAWRSDEQARQAYRQASAEFHDALSPFLLRRDKREDPAVIAFSEKSHKSLHEYRQEIEITVGDLELHWKRAVCAAESLSIIAPNADDPVAKRLRLTLGNGHGLAALLDQAKHDDDLDKQQDVADVEQRRSEGVEVTGATPDKSKREARGIWWRSVIDNAFSATRDGDALLLDHPALCAAVKAIEERTSVGEKVLVFGRFTRPLQALVALVNAREMLRCVANERPWPQAKVHGARSGTLRDSDWPAVLAAHRQLKSEVGLGELDQILDRRYQRDRRERTRLRDQILDLIEAGLRDTDADQQAFALLSALNTTASTKNSTDDERSPLILVTRALSELLSGAISQAAPKDWGEAFCELIEAATDQDQGDTDGNGHIDPTEATALWQVIEERLHEEYNRPQGGFARLMIGDTKQETRRMIQLAFNRSNSFPRVLVAQSLVGREGLNLHRACRSVLLLHPEWNPGVVEQQIGRVDRVGSRWAGLIEKWDGIDDAPVIEVMPVVFRGTYDDHNWRVLRDRWDDHRAQLHGIVVPTRLAEGNPDDERLARELASLAPNFSPTGRYGGRG